MDMPALIEQQPIPEIEEHPYVGDSVGGVDYVSGFLSKGHFPYPSFLFFLLQMVVKIIFRH